MLSKEHGVLIEILRDEKGYGVKILMTEFSSKKLLLRL